MKLIRHLPKFDYSGLTIILSNPSRFTNQSSRDDLLEATGGWFFNRECLSPETNRFCCDIRLADDRSPLITGTKCVLLLGQRALTLWTGATTTLSEQRGSPLTIARTDIPAIASFLPQDAVDIQNYEKRFNKEAEGYEEQDDEETEKVAEYLGEKGKSRTTRSNWRFWLRSDTKKALRIVENRQVLSCRYTPSYHICPGADEIISTLESTKGKDLFIDIETDFDSVDMRCFAFSFGANGTNKVPVYVVPTLDIYYRPAYDRLPQILRALSIAFRDNCVVAHNGANFDFFVFAWKYKIPIGRNVYDTMVANHRIYPDVEKSLGHCVSLWTYEPYHKNEAVHTYRTTQQAEKLYAYCGKDVYTMLLVKEAQLEFARKIPGLYESIQQANASIRSYLITSLMGLRFNENAREAWVKENDRLLTQYLRIMTLLTGPSVAPLISNQKCVRYFHDQLGYPVVARSKKTKNPSLAEDALLKLRLNHDNPVIDFLIKYRQTQKEVGTLNFEPWKDQDDKANRNQNS